MESITSNTHELFVQMAGKEICPICGGGASSVRAHSDFAGLNLYNCSSCEHVFTYPEPSDEVLARHYETKYKSDRSSYLRHVVYLSIMKQRAKAQVSLIRRFSSHLDTRADIHAVDVGCGIGSLVNELQTLGTNVKPVGYDTDTDAIEYGRTVFASDLRSEEFKPSMFPKKFDIMCMSHALEHFRDVENAIKDFRASLAPNGLLFIEVPNLHADNIEKMGDLESHISFFSRKSLTKFLEKAGFEILFCATSGPQSSFEQFHVRLRNRIKNRLQRLTGASAGTPYDGLYEKYYADDSKGIWLRAVAKLNS